MEKQPGPWWFSLGIDLISWLYPDWFMVKNLSRAVDCIKYKQLKMIKPTHDIEFERDDSKESPFRVSWFHLCCWAPTPRHHGTTRPSLVGPESSKGENPETKAPSQNHRTVHQWFKPLGTRYHRKLFSSCSSNSRLIGALEGFQTRPEPTSSRICWSLDIGAWTKTYKNHCYLWLFELSIFRIQIYITILTFVISKSRITRGSSAVRSVTGWEIKQWGL